jgi:SnoaL-like protein
VPDGLSEQLVAGIAAQDEAAIQACFADGAQFRALIPPGLRERAGAAETAARIAAWFGDSTELDLVETRAEEVGDRLHISYRFAGVEEGEPYVVEQHLFCVVGDGRIEKADLLCSGFRPRLSQ